MQSRQIILQGFEYDLWANRHWVRAIGSFSDMLRAHSILEHILQAQAVWLERCGKPIEPAGENLSLENVFASHAESWMRFIEESDLNVNVEYVNMAGTHFQESVGRIALHVINHGTYHRGHLRGLAVLELHERFPETDMIAYFREIG